MRNRKNYKKELKEWVFSIRVFSLPAIGLAIYSFIYIHDMTIDIVVAFFALFFTIYIACIQDKQLSDLHDITVKLNTDAEIQRQVKKIFPLKDSTKKYKLIYPVDYSSKTLPFIHTADSYAMNVISTYLGVHNVDLLSYARKKANSGGIEVNCEDANCDAILVCVANPFLKKILNILTISQDELEKYPINYSLPCWFVEVIDNDLWRTHKIWVRGREPSAFIGSLSDPFCKEAANLKQDVKFEDRQDTYKDVGLLAKIMKNGQQYVILAGIHGYGTCITAAFLKNLLQGKTEKAKEDDFSETLLESEQFIAIIDGEFNVKTMSVVSASIYEKLVWTKNASNWELASNL